MRTPSSIPVLLLALAPLALACAGKAPAPPPADLVLTNGRIVTLSPDRPEASALAARQGRIVAVGTDDEILRHVGHGTRRIDLQGRLAVPGLIDGHAHFSSIGEAAMTLRLAGEPTWEAIVERVGRAVAESQPGEWIIGRGWHQEKWQHPPAASIEGFPVHATLSAISPDNPVVLQHASGHALFVNAAAMKAAGIDRTTPDPAGGEILHDAAGEPTGLLRETAEELIDGARTNDLTLGPPERRQERARKSLRLANREVLSKGITTLHDAGSTYEDLDLLATMAESGEIGVRLNVMVRDEIARHRERLATARRVGAAGGKLTVRSIKTYMDGALGSRGAWLLEPYSDSPGSTGLATTPLETIRELAQLALANDYQLCVHAIGDRANRETLDIFEQAFATAPSKHDLRWRIEHAQHLDPADIPRFSKLGVIASMQAIHCTSDAPFVIARLGERRAREGAYVWRSLVDSGATVVNGTDAPVEDVDPIPNFHAAVTRRLADGGRFFPEQSLTRMEALETLTRNGAWAAFEENEKGTLEPGKLADVTVLTKNILDIPEEEILDARVAYTIVGGEVLYDADAPVEAP
ncbi:MAG: amidohydrolase [Thermoanaerobaculia bacterium]